MCIVDDGPMMSKLCICAMDLCIFLLLQFICASRRSRPRQGFGPWMLRACAILGRKHVYIFVCQVKLSRRIHPSGLPDSLFFIESKMHTHTHTNIGLYCQPTAIVIFDAGERIYFYLSSVCFLKKSARLFRQWLFRERQWPQAR